jgi:hypothetical protein
VTHKGNAPAPYGFEVRYKPDGVSWSSSRVCTATAKPYAGIAKTASVTITVTPGLAQPTIGYRPTSCRTTVLKCAKTYIVQVGEHGKAVLAVLWGCMPMSYQAVVSIIIRLGLNLYEKVCCRGHVELCLSPVHHLSFSTSGLAFLTFRSTSVMARL